MPTFTNADIMRISGSGSAYAALLLHRMVNKGEAMRIERGKYYLKGTDIYAIASNVVHPSYISLMSAFRYHGITTQILLSADVVSVRRHKAIEGVSEHKINFMTLHRDRFFGFYRDRDTGAFVAYVEKAILDALYFQNPPMAYVKEAMLNAHEERKLDTARLSRFTRLMGSATLERRVREAIAQTGIMRWSNILTNDVDTDERVRN